MQDETEAGGVDTNDGEHRARAEPSRAAHFEAMVNEARRLQEHVGKEQLDRKHMQTDSESEPEQESKSTTRSTTSRSRATT